MPHRHRLLLAAAFLAAGCGSSGGGDAALGPGAPSTGQLRLTLEYPEETEDLEEDVEVYEIHVTNRDGSVQEVTPVRVPRANARTQEVVVGPIALDQEPERLRVEAEDSAGQDIGAFETLVDVTPGTTAVEAPIFSIRKTDGAWAALGPRPSFDDAVQKVNVSGRIASVAVDPADPNRILVGSAGGGVWLTENGATSWKPLTDTAPSLAIGALAFDPADPEIAWAGTGEATTSDAFYGYGMLKSENGGRSFAPVAGTEATFERMSIARILLLPQRVVVGTYKVDNGSDEPAYGVYESVEGGEFTRIFPTEGSLEITDLARLPDGSILVAVRKDLSDPAPEVPQIGVFRGVLSEGSWTFTRQEEGFPTGTGRIELSASATAAVAYALVSGTPNANDDDKEEKFVGVYRWKDGSWTKVDATVEYKEDDQAKSGDIQAALGGQSDYNMAIAVDPQQPNRVYAAGDSRILRIEVNADTPGESTVQWMTTRTATTPHPDVHCMAFDKDGSLLLGCDGGLWRLPEPAAATETTAWDNLNGKANALETIQHTGVSIHPKDPRILTSGTQDNGTGLALNNRVWRIFATGDGGYARFDPVLERVSYQAFQRTAKDVDQHTDETRFLQRVERSADDKALVMTDISDGIAPRDPSAFYVPIQVVKDGAGRRIAVGTNRVNERTDQDTQFQPVSPAFADSIDALAYSPENPAVLYATEGGRVWVRKTNEFAKAAGQGLREGSIKYLAVAPRSPQTVYAVYGDFDAANRVYRSDDWGATFTNLTGTLENRPLNAVLVDGSFQARTVFVASDRGVFVTADEGASWQKVGTGLPNAQIMELDTQNGVLVAATHGRGVFGIQTRSGRPAVVSPPATQLTPIIPEDAPGRFRKAKKRPHQGPLEKSSLPKKPGKK